MKKMYMVIAGNNCKIMTSKNAAIEYYELLMENLELIPNFHSATEECKVTTVTDKQGNHIELFKRVTTIELTDVHMAKIQYKELSFD